MVVKILNWLDCTGISVYIAPWLWPFKKMIFKMSCLALGCCILCCCRRMESFRKKGEKKHERIYWQSLNLCLDSCTDCVLWHATKGWNKLLWQASVSHLHVPSLLSLLGSSGHIVLFLCRSRWHATWHMAHTLYT